MPDLLADWTAAELLELHTILNLHEKLWHEPAVHIIRTVQCLGTLEDLSGVLIESAISHDAQGNPFKITHKQGLLLAYWLGVSDLMRRPGYTHKFYAKELNGHFRNTIVEKVNEAMPSVSMMSYELPISQTDFQTAIQVRLQVERRLQEEALCMPQQDLSRRRPVKETVVYTYCIRSGNSVKIGKSQNVKSRLSQLQTSAATKLELIYLFNKDYEKEFHRALAQYRESGEWFTWSTQTEGFLNRMVTERNGISACESETRDINNFNMSVLLV